MERIRFARSLGPFIVIATVIWVALFAVGGCATTEVRAVTQEHLVVDVRTPVEYNAGHYPGAVNIPVSELDERLDEIGPRSQPVIVYCRSGHRSATAKKLLIEAGFTHVKDGGPKRLMMEMAPGQD